MSSDPVTNLTANPAKENYVAAKPVILGRICGHFGVNGWLKIVSYTRPASQIFQYDNWTLVCLDKTGCLNEKRLWVEGEVSAFKKNAKGLVVKLVGYDSREASAMLMGSHIGIDRSRLEPLPEGDYYWLDLIGLSVVNLEGVILGKVDHLLETGANDVLVVRSGASQDAKEENNAENNAEQRLVPWTPDVVTRVDLESGVMTVDWKEDY